MSEDLSLIRTVTNPLNEVFTFKWDGMSYEIPANESKQFPAFLAGHAAKHLAKKLLQTKGRFADQMKGDTRVYNAVTKGELVPIINALVDREVTDISVDDILNETKGLNEKPETIVAEKKQGIQEEPVGLTAEEKEFEKLKAVGFSKLKGDKRKRYQELKVKLKK